MDRENQKNEIVFFIPKKSLSPPFVGWPTGAKILTGRPIGGKNPYKGCENKFQ